MCWLFFRADRGPVNVSKVKHRSVFRYPGGKTWLVPTVRRWLNAYGKKPKFFIEPFLGGGIVSLSVAFEDLAEEIIGSELDADIAAVWLTLFGEEAEWLSKKIRRFVLTGSSVSYWKKRSELSRRQRAFRTILLNRVNRGGILTSSAGLIKQGENGKGLVSRWYPNTLSTRIKDIDTIKKKMVFISGDGIELIRKYKRRKDAVFFIDPPYTVGQPKAGERLYNHFNINHEILFKLLSSIKGDFLMTYADSKEIRTLARAYKFEVKSIAMKTTHHSETKELLISKSLRWFR